MPFPPARLLARFYVRPGAASPRTSLRSAHSLLRVPCTEVTTVPIRACATAAVMAALLLGGAGLAPARAESDWLGKAFEDKAADPQKPRRRSPPLTKPAVTATQQKADESEAALRRERAKQQAAREAEREAELRRMAAKAKREQDARVAGPASAPAAPVPEVPASSSPAAPADPPRMGLGVVAPTVPDAHEPAAVRPRPPAGPAAPALKSEVPARSVRPEEPKAFVAAAAPSLAVPPVIERDAAALSPLDQTTQLDVRAASVARGRRLWQLRRGPRHASLEGCDLGLGSGRVVGTFAHLPRHFSDTGRVMDLESRLLWCAGAQQELQPASLLNVRAIEGVLASEIEDLAAYVASLSISWRLSAPMEHARERQALAVGQALYARRQGPLDFSCATCHGDSAPGAASQPSAQAVNVVRVQSIRVWQGQALPALSSAAEAQATIPSWPAWRASQGALRTLQGRLGACFWHMGVEPPAPASDAMIALVSYLTKLADKGEVAATGRKP
jgi:L-cysteine S-thiosulfotransferase